MIPCAASDSQALELSRPVIRSFLVGAVEVREDEEGMVPWRLDPGLETFYRPVLKALALMTAGVHLRFQTAATGFILEFDVSAIEERSLTAAGWTPFSKLIPEDLAMDVFINGCPVKADVRPRGDHCALVLEGLEGTAKEINIHFPLRSSVRIRRLAVVGGSDAAAAPRRPRWVTHGSSITHCRRAASPGFTWPAIVARQKGWDAWNLGFAGQCKFDPVVARVISRMPADRISLCLGINTASGSYGLQTWIPAVEGFIMTVRDGHPATPLLIISPILSPPRETTDEPPATIGLRTMRRTLETIVAKFVSKGDSHIFYLDGTEIIGPGDEHTMPDELHPDADGIKLMAERFLQRMPPAWQG